MSQIVLVAKRLTLSHPKKDNCSPYIQLIAAVAVAAVSVTFLFGTDVSDSFEFTNTSGQFTLGTSPKSVTFTGGEAKSIGNLSLYHSGSRSFMVDAGQTGTITFETPAATLDLFFRDQNTGVRSELTVLDTNNQVITTFNGTSSSWTNVSFSNQMIGSITLQNNGSSGYAVIDDFSFCAAQQIGPELTEKLFFAQFGNGPGLISDIVLTNPSATNTISGRVDFLDDNGLPFLAGIVGTGETSSVDFSVSPLGTATISTDGQGAIAVVGSAVISSEGTLGGVIRFNISGVGIAGVGASEPLSGFVVPVRREAGGINTGVAIHNTEETAVTLDLTLRDPQGVLVPNGTSTIADFPAGGHLAQFIGGGGLVLFPDADTDDFQGTLVVQVTGGNVATAALELGTAAGEFTTLPVTPLE